MQAVGSIVLAMILFQHHMIVATTKTKSTHSSSSRRIQIGLQPGAGFGIQIEGRVFESQLGIRLGNIERGREDFVVKCEGSFD